MINELMQQSDDTMSDTSLLEKRYQLMLSMNQKKWEQKFTEMEAKFRALSDQVSSQLNKMSSSRAQPQSAPSMGNYHSETPQQMRGAQQQVRQAPQEHPRSAGNSEDVSIEKYFYCGNKK